MRTLFAKILLLFWLAFAIVIGATVLLEGSMRRRGFEPPDARNDPFATLAALAQTELDHAGREGVLRVLDAARADRGMAVFALDTTGTELRGLAVPPEVASAAHDVLASGRRLAFRPDERLTVGYPLAGRGERFALVIEPFAHRQRPGPPQDLWLSGLILLVVSGLATWLLARAITAPVQRLRAATQRLAEGDLGARVGPQGRTHDELGELGLDFDRMAARMESVVSAQRRLLSDISHELRSPLARMAVALGLLRQRELPGIEDMLARLETEADRLNGMIGDLLLLSRLESDAPDARQPIALGELVTGIVDDASFEASERDCDVQLTACDDALRVDGVPELVHSAIENVVRNAVRHTAAGSVVGVVVEPRRDADGAWAIVRVRDHGPGVPAAELERIFEPFHRVEDARERGAGGVGLGLAIAQRAILRHRGRIVARAADGGGLEVTIALPRADA